MSEIRTAYSAADQPDQAVAELVSGLGDGEFSCIGFFACPDYDQATLAAALNTQFADLNVFGCTTAGEIYSGGYSERSITAFALPRDEFAVATLVLEQLHGLQPNDPHVKRKVEDIQHCLDMGVPDAFEHTFAFCLMDGMSVYEELALQAFNVSLEGIPLVGGSAGDNLNFRETMVFHNGRFYRNAAVISLIKTIRPFRVFSGHHLRASTGKFVVTRAEPGARRVLEFNAEPAALEYCRQNGLQFEDLNSDTFALYPLAVKLGDLYYIRSIKKVHSDLSLSFFCAIDSGVVLSQMESDGLLDHTRAILGSNVEALGHPELVIGCECIHNRVEANRLKVAADMSKLYQRHNVIGFNTYGEQSEGMHVNHTFTGVALGKNPL